MARWPFAVFLSFSLGVLVPVSWAEDLDSLFDLTIQELLDVKISGVTLREQSAQDVPASINVFSRDAIDRLGVNTLVDLTRFVPGFQVFRGDDGNGFTYASRGRVVATPSREILVLVNGVRLDQWWTGGSLFLISRFPLAHVERVEFIRGPVSHIYGANAFLGVINIVTGQADNEVSITTGTHTRYDINGYTNFKTGEVSHAFQFNEFNDKGEEYKAPVSPINSVKISDPLETRNIHYTGKLKSWTLDGAYYESFYDKFYSVGNINPDYSSHDYSLGLINANHQVVLTRLNSNLSFGYKSYKKKSFSQLLPSGTLAPVSLPSSTDPLIGLSRYRGDESWLKWNGGFQIDSKTFVQLGAEYRQNRMDDVYTYTNYDLIQLLTQNYPVTFYNDFINSVALAEPEKEVVRGVFTQLTRDADTFSASIGARYDDSKLAGFNLSPNFSLVYKGVPNHSFKLIYGEAFRQPTTVEYFLKNNPLGLGNLDIKPEVVKTTDLIWFYQKNAKRIQVGVFKNRFEDSIGIELNSSSRMFANLGSDSSEGIELSWFQPVRDGFSTRIAFNRIWDKPDNMFRLAENKLNFALVFNGGRWHGELDYSYESERRYLSRVDNTLQVIDDYGAVNGHLNYQLLSNVEIFVTGSNIFGEEYAYPSVTTSFSAIPARGRELEVGVSYKF